jgi:FkbM family methyltransferase
MMLSGRPNSAAPAFLSDCLSARDIAIPPEDAVTADGENGHVINVLGRVPHRERVHYLETAWNCSIPHTVSPIFIWHYTNFLREALHTQIMERLSYPWIPVNEAETRLRELFAHHCAHRMDTIARLASDPSYFENFQAEVLTWTRLEYPRLVINDSNAWLWRQEFALGLLELPTVEFVRRLVRPDMWIVDGGAHVGYFSDVFLTAGASPEHILAIEAHPDNAATLRRNVELHGVKVLEAALGDADRQIPFYDGLGHSNSSLIGGGPTSGKTYNVNMRMLDSVAKELGIDKLSLMKLDVEGAEPAALAGARDTLRRSNDVVLIVECNPRMLSGANTSPEALVRSLGAMGFIGKMILDDFSLGPAGLVFPHRTMNVAFARPSRWKTILSHNLNRTDITSTDVNAITLRGEAITD